MSLGIWDGVELEVDELPVWFLSSWDLSCFSWMAMDSVNERLDGDREESDEVDELLANADGLGV